MKFRAYILTFLLCIVGIAVISRGQAVSTIRSQEWLEQHTPSTLQGYEVVPGPDGSDVTYRLDETRDALQAAGLVGRVFRRGNQAFDVVIVYSDRGESFHDPAACFGAQGWTILSQQLDTILTDFGRLEINSLVVRSEDGDEHPAAYCFGSGSRLFPTQTQLLRSLFWSEVTSFKSSEGAMYRFIALTPGAGQDDVRRFAARFLSSVHGLAGRE